MASQLFCKVCFKSLSFTDCASCNLCTEHVLLNNCGLCATNDVIDNGSCSHNKQIKQVNCSTGNCSFQNKAECLSGQSSKNPPIFSSTQQNNDDKLNTNSENKQNNDYAEVFFNQCGYYDLDLLNAKLAGNKRPNDIFLIHFNIRSLQKNIDKLSDYISTLDKQPEIIALTETKLKIGNSL